MQLGVVKQSMPLVLSSGYHNFLSLIPHFSKLFLFFFYIALKRCISSLLLNCERKYVRFLLSWLMTAATRNRTLTTAFLRTVCWAFILFILRVSGEWQKNSKFYSMEEWVTLSTPEKVVGIFVLVLLLKKSRYLMSWLVSTMNTIDSIYEKSVCAYRLVTYSSSSTHASTAHLRS